MIRYLRLIILTSFLLCLQGCYLRYEKSVSPEFEYVQSFKTNTNIDFSVSYSNTQGDLKRLISLIIKDTVSFSIKENFKPNFNKYCYVFSCFELDSLEYSPRKEAAGEIECYKWYGEEYHILNFFFKSEVPSGKVNIYRVLLPNDGKKGFREDC